MDKKTKKVNPHGNRTVRNPDYFFVVRGTKSTLVCKHKKPNLITGSSDSLDEIVIEINNKNQKLKIELAPDYIKDLASDCLEVINSQSFDFDYAHKFLTKKMKPTPKIACNLMFNIMCNNSIGDIEGLYDHLEAHGNDPQSTIPEDIVDTEDQILYENASTVCRYLRQMKEATTDLHKSTEAFLLHIADTTDLIEHANDEYWLDRFLTISYMPYQKRTLKPDKSGNEPYYAVQCPVQVIKERMNQPWRLSISWRTIYINTKGEAMEDGATVKSLDINLSDKDFKRFLSCICKESDVSIPEFSCPRHE